MEPDSELHIAIYDAYARLLPRRQQWQIVVRGYVGTPRPDTMRRRIFLRIVQRAMRFTDEEMASPLFRERVHDFLMRPARGCELQVQLDGVEYVLPRKTRGDGSFQSAINIRGEFPMELLDSERNRRVLSIERVSAAGLSKLCNASAELIAPRGYSVISDIDDTMKLSQVGDRRSLLANTFLRPFVAVPGMAESYQAWQARGTVFHYVSSSPWQLYRPLHKFVGDSGFPTGTFHLRPLRLRGPRIMELFVGRKTAKRKAIKGLLRWYPQRRFIFVGDSGEKDPEIYGSFARRFPKQVAQIFIRRIPGTPLDPDRLNRAFRRVPRECWRVFSDPAELTAWEPKDMVMEEP